MHISPWLRRRTRLDAAEALSQLGQRPNKRLKLAARVDCGMNLSSARRSLSAIRYARLRPLVAVPALQLIGDRHGVRNCSRGVDYIQEVT